MEKRLKQVLRVLGGYGVGDFTLRLPVSSKQDDIGVIVTLADRLGEHLKSTMISRDYFEQILNAVPDMVLILNAKGEIIDMNEAVHRQLGYLPEVLFDKTISDLHASDKPFSAAWLKQVMNSHDVSYLDSSFRSADGRIVPVHVAVLPLSEPSQRITEIMIIAEANSLRLQDENMVVT